MAKAIVLGILCLFALPLHAEDRTEIDLGGPRKVNATIIESEDSYTVGVSFLPVSAFDPIMNKRLSHEKAKRYAVEALLRYLEVNHVSLRKSETLRIGTEENRFFMQLSIPKDGLATSKERPKIAKKKDGAKKASSPIKAKSDFEETLSIIVEANESDLPKITTDLATFYLSVSDAEDTALSRLLTLTEEIKSDRWLLSIERDELLVKTNSEEARYLDLLRKRIAKVEKDNSNVDK